MVFQLQQSLGNEVESPRQLAFKITADFVERVLSLMVQESPLKFYFRLWEDKKVRSLFKGSVADRLGLRYCKTKPYQNGSADLVAAKFGMQPSHTVLSRKLYLQKLMKISTGKRAANSIEANDSFLRLLRRKEATQRNSLAAANRTPFRPRLERLVLGRPCFPKTLPGIILVFKTQNRSAISTRFRQSK